MKNLVRLFVIVAAFGATPERLTLQEFCGVNDVV